MKEFAAFILLIVLICVGWNQPYKAHFGSVIGEPPPVPSAPAPERPPATSATPPAAVAVPQATPGRDNSWRWKKSTLDRKEKEGEKHGR